MAQVVVNAPKQHTRFPQHKFDALAVACPTDATKSKPITGTVKRVNFLQLSVRFAFMLKLQLSTDYRWKAFNEATHISMT